MSAQPTVKHVSLLLDTARFVRYRCTTTVQLRKSHDKLMAMTEQKASKQHDTWGQKLQNSGEMRGPQVQGLQYLHILLGYNLQVHYAL